jgi:hypothetical protein
LDEWDIRRKSSNKSAKTSIEFLEQIMQTPSLKALAQRAI